MINRAPAGLSAGGEFTHSADGKADIPATASIRLQEAKNAEETITLTNQHSFCKEIQCGRRA